MVSMDMDYWGLGFRCSFSVRSETEAKLFLLRSETGWFVSFVSQRNSRFHKRHEMKWSEMKRKKRSEMKRKKRSENKYFEAKWRGNNLYLYSLWSETKNTVAKRSKTKTTEAKRSEKKKYGSETKRKEKFMKQNIYAIFCLGAKRKIRNELSEKKRTNLCEIFA